ncbi:hypothetical protein [Streptomyces sp. NPDC048710]|uniref:hypothetical protein n=1 Tax=unclassified Streptomyces TaxID=2593676 RepID=UPI003713C428
MVLVGLVVVLVGFLVALSKVDRTSISAVYAGLTGVTGTLVGAYFGLQAGQSGRDRSDDERQKANTLAVQLAAAAHPDVATPIVGKPPQ